MIRILILCLFPAFLIAQDGPERRFEAGIAFGFNAAQIDGDNLAGFNQFGFNAGPYANIVLAKRWRVGVELLFSQKGSRSAANSTNTNFVTNYRLNYAEIPILAHFHDWKSEKNGKEFWKIRATLGPYIGRTIATKITIDGFDVTDQPSFAYNKNDFGIIAGAALFITPNIGFEFRWSTSFISLRPRQFDAQVNRLLTIRGLYQF